MEKAKKKTTSKKTTKKPIKVVKQPKYHKYIFPSVIFGLMLAGFNYVFLILALYSPCYSGIYMQIFDNVVLNVLVNTTFQFLLFGLSFFVVAYLFIEVVINKHN